MNGARAFVVLLLAWAAIGCGEFAPTKPFPCSTNGKCPSGYSCDQGSRLCYGNGQRPDGGGGDLPFGTGGDGTDGSTEVDVADSPSAADTPPDQPHADLPAEMGTDIPPAVDAPGDAAMDVQPADAKKSNGQACGDSRDCASGACADGVCCDGACSTPCMACTNALTGQATGKCSAVKAGMAHGPDCATSDPSTCGQNGKCDGTGACQKHPAGTMCKGESCAAGTATYSPMSTCNAQGTCTPMNRACDNNLRCAADGMRCRSNCGTDNDCVDAAYCDGALCFPDLDPKAACTRSEQCKSGLCGGRCCNAGTPCKCPQPNTMNIVKNPGLETDISGWIVDQGRIFDPEDADGCPFSGSLYNPSDDGFKYQCVIASPSTNYNFGAMVKPDLDGSVQLCQVLFFDSPACDTVFLPQYGQFNYNVAPGKWTQVTGTVQSPAGAIAAEIGCVGYKFKIDKMYLTPAPGAY